MKVLGIVFTLFTIGVLLLLIRPPIEAMQTMADDSTDYPVYLPCVGRSCAQPPANEETPLPDLYPYYYVVHYYNGCAWGSPGDILVRVRNVGLAGAGPFEVDINRLITTVDFVAAGSYQDASVKFGSGPVGGMNIQVDAGCQVYESNEVNNNFQVLFTPPPACTPSSTQIPAQP
jgi:hypothetical protein